ncbi:MAG: type IV pilus modification PilV family protein, partial [Aeromonas sp.]
MQRQLGFGLLEILITLVLLGVGASGLVALSRNNLGLSQNARHYELAMRLAESELDQLRNFNALLNASAPQTSYAAIASGSKNATLSGVTYAVSWQVNDQYWQGSAWQTARPSAYPLAYPGRKAITLSVSWPDSQGQTQTLQLSSAISPQMSLSSGQLNGGLAAERVQPRVSFNPGVAPDVVSVVLGDGNRQETSKPAPIVVAKSGDLGKEVQFDTVTYRPDGASNSQLIQQDISTVSCACNYAGNAASALPAQAYSPAGKQLYWRLGQSVTKASGSNSDSKNQPALCTRCCSDHFDGGQNRFEDFYAPLNTARKRYDRNLAVANSGAYIDACRFIRLDGLYQPAPDWNLIKVVVMSSDFLAKPANVASYQNYLAYVVKTYIDWQQQTLRWSSNPTASEPAISDFATWLATPSNVAAGGDSNTQISMTIGSQQFIARGIYVDILAPTYLANLDTSQSDYLARVPFQEINLTMLANWSISGSSAPLTGNLTDYASVANEPISTIVDLNNYYFGTYRRGFFTGKQASKDSNNQLQAIYVQAEVYQGNSGVSASLISPRDKTLAKTAQLSVRIDSSGGPTPQVTVSGKVQCLTVTSPKDTSPAACSKNDYAALTLATTTSGATCVLNRPSANNQTATYTCSAASGSQLVLNFSYSKTGWRLAPAGLSISMTPPANSQAIDGPCALLVQNSVTN